jgi:hypothetical protein
MARHSLPERPDLDQLRRQAKELRRSVLAGDGDAIERLLRVADVDPATVTLSTAQLVIARESGFASWPRLTEALRTGPGEPSVAPGLRMGSREPCLSRGLIFEKAVAARALEPGQVVVLDGRVVELGPAPERAGRVRIGIVTALGAPPGDRPDPREIVLTCEDRQGFCTARRIGPREPLRGPGLTFEDYGLEFEADIVGVKGLDPGRIIVLDGEVVTCEPDARGSVRLVIHVGPSRRGVMVVCPADMELPTARREDRGPRRGLLFDKALAAGRLEAGQVVVVNGHVLESGPDPGDASRVRLVLVTAWSPGGGPSAPDQREMVLSCPRDMNLATAIPQNLDGPTTNADASERSRHRANGGAGVDHPGASGKEEA